MKYGPIERARYKARYLAKKKAGICVVHACMERATCGTRCENCWCRRSELQMRRYRESPRTKERQRAWDKEYRRIHEALGLCQRCPSPVESPRYVRCARCRQHRREQRA